MKQSPIFVKIFGFTKHITDNPIVGAIHELPLHILAKIQILIF